MSSDTSPFVHPVTRFVHGLKVALDDLGDADPMYMLTDAKAETLVELSVLSSRLEGLRLQVIAASDDVAEQDGCRNVSSWLGPRTRTDYGPNGASERLSGDLEEKWRRVGAGLRDGRVNLAQSKVIVRALNNLGDDIPPLVLGKAEAHLVEQAELFSPKQLRVLGDKILEVVAPDLYEDEERKKLEKSEQRAAAQTKLSMTDRGDGTVDLKARIPESDAARLKRYLEAFTSPRHDANTPGGGRNIDPATGQKLPHDRVLGNAFRAFLESVDPMRMPIQGGDATKVIVTIPWTDLKAGVGVGMLGDGTRITAGEVRRLACNAGILPAVLGGKSEVLDLGRMRRLYNGKQRQAMAIENPECRAEGCTIPAAWCEGHHFSQSWVDGGKTDLKDGKLLCPWHHNRAHDSRYLAKLTPNGDVRFSRRR
jgi:hypothetical protein